MTTDAGMIMYVTLSKIRAMCYRVAQTGKGEVSITAVLSLLDQMAEPDTYVTASGHRELTEAAIQALADEAEQGYDIDQLIRRPGREAMVEQLVRFPPGMLAEAEQLAADESTSVSEIVRAAVGPYLEAHGLRGTV